MCIQIILPNKSIQVSSMYSPKPKSSIDDQEKTSLNSTDAEPSTRTYAVIETDSNELEHILDLLRQFFPRTKILEYKSYPQRSENDEQISSNVNSPTFKGKVKDYLQRRYLEQMDEHHQTRKDIFIKSYSLDSSSMQVKRDYLQRYTTIDLDDTEKNLDQINEKSHSYFEQSTRKNKINHFPLPCHPLSEQEQEQRISSFPSGIPLPPTPYSASSDPGPFHSPWFNTPTSTFNFRFPQSQESAVASAQGSIAQLSTLTKMLCDEPSVFTPISPRFKIEKTSMDSSSIPPCQICREEFDSHQTYLNHYRRHLENSDEDDKLDCDLRNYSCEICSKRFSRSDMLNRHLRLHSGVRPYRCTMCNTTFSRSDHLSTHLRTHTGEKPYTCPHCSYAACRRDMITRHLKIHGRQRTERKNATSTNDS